MSDIYRGNFTLYSQACVYLSKICDIHLQMSKYPVQSYDMDQRMTILERGLHDKSDLVQTVVTDVLLAEWFRFSNNNYLMFLNALRTDVDEVVFSRFMCIAQKALLNIFK